MRVSVEVELVGHHQAERAVGTLAEGLVSKDLGRGADDRGLGVNRGVAGDHPDVFRSEVSGQGEELLRNEGLDGGGVDAAFTPGHRSGMGGGGHQ